MISSNPWVWLSAILTICSFTLLYGDNKFFRFSEYTYVAIVIAHNVIVGIETLEGRFRPLLQGTNLMLIIPLILGIMVLFVAYRPYAWIASIPYAVMIGINTGLVVRAAITTNIVGTVRSTIAETSKIFVGQPLDQLGYLVRVTFTIGAMFYFLFTVFNKGTGSGVVGYLREFGKYALLIFLGLALGNSAMQNSGLATSALNRLLRQWLGFG